MFCKCFDWKVEAAIAQWILQSCVTEFDSQAQNLRPFQIQFELLLRRGRKLIKKESGLAHILIEKRVRLKPD